MTSTFSCFNAPFECFKFCLAMYMSNTGTFSFFKWFPSLKWLPSCNHQSLFASLSASPAFSSLPFFFFLSRSGRKTADDFHESQLSDLHAVRSELNTIRSRLAELQKKCKSAFRHIFSAMQREITLEKAEQQQVQETEEGEAFSKNDWRPIYTTEKFWHGSDTNGTGTKNSKILHHLHGCFLPCQSQRKSCFCRVLGSSFWSAY